MGDRYMTIQPAIIEVALNGATPRSKNPHVPVTPKEVAQQGLACIDAGAAIVHNHTRDPVLGGTGIHGHEEYEHAWRDILAQRSDAILYPTMSGSRPGLTIEQRYAHVEALADAGVLGMGLVDPGSTDIGFYETDGTPRADDIVYINSWADSVYMVESCRQREVGLSVSIFEPGFVRFVMGYVKAGKLPKGTMIKFYFGGDNVGFGLPPTPKALDAYLEMLGDSGLPWLVSVQGGDIVECGLAQYALRLGGHVQVGLEPNSASGKSNVELVEQAVALARTCGREPATCAQARQMLGLRTA